MDMDDAYSNGAYIDRAFEYPDRWTAAAADHRELEHMLGRARLNVPYGSGDKKAFDLFYPAGRPKGLAVFVHGGYWMQFDRKDWSHFAAGLTMLDWAVAVPSYPLAPTVTIPQIGWHIADAITLAAGMVSGPIVLTGHSAGGQLVARMAMENAGLGPDVAARIHNIVPISPVGDLRPLLQTGMNSRLGLNAETAVAESPSLHAKHMKTQVHTWVGADERPAFLAQAKQLADAWNGPLTVEPDRHHFDVIDGLLDPEHPLCRAIDLA